MDATTETPGLDAALDVEKWLKGHGVKHAPPRMYPMDQIDVRESRRNQVRAEALIPEAVDRYAVRFKNGEMCPPLVAYKRGGKLVLIDGNHRDAGARKASVRELPVIVVESSTSSEMIVLLKAEANANHGLATDSAWRDQQALNMIDVGWDVAQAARSTGLSTSAVEIALRVRDYDERAARLGVKGWSGLAKTARGVIGGLKSDPVFAAAARMVIETEWGSGAPLTAFIRDVRAQPSESDALALIGSTTEQRMAARKAAKQAGRRLGSPKHEVTSALGMLAAIREKRYIASIPVWFITPEDRAEVRRRLNDGLEVLAEIEAALDENPPVAG